MYKSVKKLGFFLITFTLLSFNTSRAGADFFALKVSPVIKDIHNVQKYLSHRIKDLKLVPTKNLHITLKEIGDLNDSERKMVKKYVYRLANKFKKFNIENLLQSSKIYITKNGLVLLVLRPNKDLTNLAFGLDKKLQHLKENHKIRSLKKRVDFPNFGHITLGKLTSKISSKELSNISNIKKKFKIRASKSLFVDKFSLLKSNHPAKNRVYNTKNIFILNYKK